MENIPKDVLKVWIMEYKKSKFEKPECLDGLLILIEEYE